MHERGVQPPGEPLGEGGGRDLGRPVVVAGVPVAGQTVVGEGLHEPVELGAEPALAEVGAGVDEVALTLPPLSATVLKPNLKQNKINNYSIKIFISKIVR